MCGAAFEVVVTSSFSSADIQEFLWDTNLFPARDKFKILELEA